MHHLVELPFGFNQFKWGSALLHSPILHHHDPVVIGYRHQAVSNRYHCNILETMLDHFLNMLVSGSINI